MPAGPARPPVRMKDIARDLGVSLMTVSKALRNHSDISEQTRARVLKRMKELNYQPDWIARSLVTRRTYLVGLVIPDLMHSFFAEVAKGVARRLEPGGYHVVIFNSEENPEAETRQIELLLQRKVDGLIIASAHHSGDAEIFRTLAVRQTPYVLIDRQFSGLQANYVGSRDEEIGEMATDHLIERGCRRVAHIRGPAVPTGAGRMKGYRRSLARHRLAAPAEYVVRGLAGDNTGHDAMTQLLEATPRPDGVFCYNDPVAAGAIKAILEAGLRVPEDIAIIGVGNVHYSDLLRVPLSTIDQSSPELGEKAADLLAACMDAKIPPAPSRILIPARLVERDSTRRSK